MELNLGMRADYQALWDTMRITPDRLPGADTVVARILAARPRYELTAAMTHVPWFVIAIIHQLEGDGNFHTHLHNGDSLNHRTVTEPRGRPPVGDPPFTWEASAIDALLSGKLSRWTDWGLTGILFKFEEYNGWGYRHEGRPHTPYLWSGTQHYTQGKFVKDGPNGYSPTAVSRQIGCAVLLRRLADAGAIHL